MEKKIKELQEKFDNMDVLLDNILKNSKEALRILQESNAKAAIREAEHKARMMQYTTNSTFSEEDYLLNKPVKPRDILPVKKVTVRDILTSKVFWNVTSTAVVLGTVGIIIGHILIKLIGG